MIEIEAVVSIEDREKCTKQPVPIVGRKQKFPSNQMEAVQCTAATATANANQKGISKTPMVARPTKLFTNPSTFFSYFFLFIKNLQKSYLHTNHFHTHLR